MTISTWLDGYLALRHRAFADRGSIELPDGTRWPRTTGEQVAAIAATFTPAVRAHAVPRIVRQWRSALADIERNAFEDLHDTYVHNRTFWATLENVALHLDGLSLRPPTMRAWNALLPIISTETPRNVPDGPFKHFDNVRTYDELANEQYKYLLGLRGFDELDPPPYDESSYGSLGPKKKIPRSTNLDVLSLAGYWGKQLEDVKEVFGHAGIEKRWNLLMKDVAKHALYGNPTLVYPENNRFWRCLWDTAVHIAVADEAPSKWDMAKDAIKDSVVNLPNTIKTVAGKGADAIADTAQAAGRVVNAAGKGLFSGAGTPILIGVGVLGAVLLLRRGRSREEA
jgi:hypothetical protein